MLSHALKTPRAPNRAVVVGAGGFVGAAIARALQRRDVAVRPITRSDVDLLAEGAAEALAALLDAEDAVVLVAAVAPVKTPAMLRDNITIIEAMAEAVRRVRPAYCLNIGSDAVFADSTEPLTEASCRAPASLHGIMHLAREVMFAEALEGQAFATLRPTLIYGADDPHNGYGPNRFRRLAAAGEPIALFGNGEERRDHVWVEDVAELAARMVFQRSTGSLNAVTGQVISFHDLAGLIRAQYGGPVEIVSTPRSGPMPHNGYRPFDPTTTLVSFPGFHYTKPADGFAAVHAEASKA